MKVAVFERFGGPEVLELVDSPKPLPTEDEILIKVHATTVTAAECHMRRGRPLWGRLILGVVRPRRRRRTLGLELAGEVVSVGKNVRRFKPGDTVTDSPVSARAPTLSTPAWRNRVRWRSCRPT